MERTGDGGREASGYKEQDNKSGEESERRPHDASK